MPSFLWSGIDREGRQKNEFVEAENAREAKVVLLNRGWTQLELLGDETMDAVHAIRSPVRKERRAGVDALLKNPDFRATRARGNRPSFFGKWRQALLREKVIILIQVAVIGFGIYSDSVLLFLLAGVGLSIQVFKFPVQYAFYSQTRRNYLRLKKAKVWGRWQEVLDCLERLDRSEERTGIAVNKVELLRNHALALAALGRLDEAVADFEKIERFPGLQHWLYLAYLAGVYETGRQFEKGLELRRQAAEEKPDMASLWIGYASSCVRRLNRPVEAREALARAEQLEITARSKPWACFIHGVIFWREHKLAEAREQLEKALAGFKPFSRDPFKQGQILLTKAHFCIVNAELRNTAQARTLFAEVEPYLKAHRQDELLAAYRAATATA